MVPSMQDFGNGFAWGVSTSAYQIEGAHLRHGKGLSIWDEFSHIKGKIYNNHNGDIACDFYQNFNHDLSLMRALNIRHFRFSLSWSRIFPLGLGQINKEGVDFYNRVIDFCLELEIQPWITLYHWDLPAELEKSGGWTNRDIVGWFSDYAAFCIKTFGDRVSHWMILNEPLVFTGAGYFLGIHAPGKKSLTAFLKSAHHAALCQAEGGRVLRSSRSDIKIGTTFSCSHIEPQHYNTKDIQSAIRMDALLNRLFIEPLLGFGYPFADLKMLERMQQYMKDGDDRRLVFDMDFLGLQCYTREIVTHSMITPLIQARILDATERAVYRTVMNWEVFPESIYHILKKISAYDPCKQIIVTENGAAFQDRIEDGKINDVHRKQFLQDHIQQVLRAKKEGVNVNGYFVWTFTDNFEWAKGYLPRFGLVYVDFATQKRIIKSSGLWLSEFLSEKRENPVLQQVEQSGESYTHKK